MENFNEVLHQMADFGIVMRPQDRQSFPKRFGKRVTCGAGGKFWYWLNEFRRDSGKVYLVGRIGSYKSGDSEKITHDWEPINDAERARRVEQQERERAEAQAARDIEIANAAMDAITWWRRGSKEGVSPYLQCKGLEGESCRYMAEDVWMRWPDREPGEQDVRVFLPAGTLLVPLLRFDFERSEALRGLQFIRPDGAKIYMRGFGKPGCALRLGEHLPSTALMCVVEGYATGLTVRLAIDKALPVYVALDAGNLMHVVPLLRVLYPAVRMLVCADDDWKTVDRQSGKLSNPGRTVAKQICKMVDGCDFVYPIFPPSTRQLKDTDFDDLRQRVGLDAVREQLAGVIRMMERVHG